jgi:hypothetical protein
VTARGRAGRDDGAGEVAGAGGTGWPAIKQRVPHLRLVLPFCAAVLVAATAVGWLVAAPAGGVGAALGVAVVVASYTSSTLAIAWADSVNPRLVFGVGMGMYVTKFSLFGFMLIAVNATHWPGKLAMATGIVVGVVAWTGAQIWWTVRTSRRAAVPVSDR